MALQSSGPIKFSEIAAELGVGTSNFSIKDAEGGIYSPINTSSVSRPDGSVPFAMSEWYNYVHAVIISILQTDLLFGWNFESNTNDIKGVVNGVNTAPLSYLVSNSSPSFVPLKGLSIANNGSGYVEFPYNSMMDITNSFTISLWAYRNSNIGGSYFISKTNASNNDNNYSVVVDYLSDSFSFYSTASGQIGDIGGISSGKWYHIVYTYDGTTFKGYRNGTLYVSTTISFTLPTGGTNPLRLFTFDGTSYSPNGGLDMVYFWSRPITSTEVSILYNSSYGLQLGSGLYLESSILASYPGTGTDWYDLGSNALTVTLQNGTTFDSMLNSISFDGIDDYCIIPTGSNFDLSGTNFTLEAYFNITNITVPNVVMCKDRSGSTFDWCMYMPNSNTISIYSNGTSTNVSAYVPGGLLNNTWYHCVITSISGVIYIYLDGLLLTSASMSISNDSSVNSLVLIGAESSISLHFSGYIRLVRIYKMGSTAIEVLSRYHDILYDNSMAITYLPVDYCSLYLDGSYYSGTGLEWFDLSANSNTGTLTNGVVYSSSNSGVMVFDGVDDCVDFPPTNLSSTGDITIDTFLKLDGPQVAYADIIDYSHASGGFVIQQNYGASADSFYFAWWNGSGYDFCFFQVPIDNTYFHLVITKKGGSVIVYINGVASFTGSGSSYLEATGKPMKIGDFVSGGRPIKGTIGDFRIYDICLSLVEIWHNYTILRTRFGL